MAQGRVLILGAGMVAAAAAVAAWVALRLDRPAPGGPSADPPRASAVVPAPAVPAPRVAPAPSVPDPLAGLPAFDVVRVAADGGALIAGRAAPGAMVEVLLDTVGLTRTAADASGEFVAMLTLAPSAEPQVLSLAMMLGDGSLREGDEVVILAPRLAPVAEAEAAPVPVELAAAPEPAPEAVEVAAVPEPAPEPVEVVADPGPAPEPVEVVADPEPATEPVEVVAVSDPAPEPVEVAVAPDPAPEPAEVAAVPDPSPEPVELAAAPEPADLAAAQPPDFILDRTGQVRILDSAPQLLDNVVIDSIAYDATGAVEVAGRSRQPGSGVALRLYLDNRPVALVRSVAGGWRADLSGAAPGIYTLRVDELDPQGQVVSRFETPFLREDPQTVARLLGPAPAAEPAPTPAPASAAEAGAEPAPSAPAVVEPLPEPVELTAAPAPSAEPPPERIELSPVPAMVEPDLDAATGALAALADPAPDLPPRPGSARPPGTAPVLPAEIVLEPQAEASLALPQVPEPVAPEGPSPTFDLTPSQPGGVIAGDRLSPVDPGVPVPSAGEGPGLPSALPSLPDPGVPGPVAVVAGLPLPPVPEPETRPEPGPEPAAQAGAALSDPGPEPAPAPPVAEAVEPATPGSPAEPLAGVAPAVDPGTHPATSLSGDASAAAETPADPTPPRIAAAADPTPADPTPAAGPVPGPVGQTEPREPALAAGPADPEPEPSPAQPATTRTEAVDANAAAAPRGEAGDIPDAVAEPATEPVASVPVAEPVARIVAAPAQGASDLPAPTAAPVIGSEPVTVVPSVPAADPLARTESDPDPAEGTATRTASVPATLPSVPRVTLITVQPGHSLWRISREHYGEGTRYLQIYRANRGQIRNPNLIYPGQIFALPD